MAAFNSMPTMTGGAPPNNGIAMNHANGQGISIDTFDQNLTFDDALM